LVKWIKYIHQPEPEVFGKMDVGKMDVGKNINY